MYIDREQDGYRFLKNDCCFSGLSDSEFKDNMSLNRDNALFLFHLGMMQFIKRLILRHNRHNDGYTFSNEKVVNLQFLNMFMWHL